jgi:serine/threonine protein kinase
MCVFVCPQGGLLLSQALTILLQVVAAVKHLHKLGILHRDARSVNVLVVSLDPLNGTSTDAH